MEHVNFKLDHCINLIMDGLVVFQKYENTNYHKVMIIKHNTLIYYVENDILKVGRILQNFQDPEENLKNLTKE